MIELFVKAPNYFCEKGSVMDVRQGPKYASDFNFGYSEPITLEYRITLKCSETAEVLLGKSVRKICSKFTGENPCRSVILRHGCSPVNLLHIFRTPFPKNTSGWLFLNVVEH